jgi:hypothetical protein
VDTIYSHVKIRESKNKRYKVLTVEEAELLYGSFLDDLENLDINEIITKSSQKSYLLQWKILIIQMLMTLSAGVLRYHASFTLANPEFLSTSRGGPISQAEYC